MVAAIDALLTSGWLSKVPKGFQTAVLDRCQVRKFNKGVAIYRVGDPPTGMFGVVDGAVGVEIALAEREPHIIAMARPGTWFGLRAVATRKPRNVNLVARSKAELLFLPAAAIDEIIEQDPQAWRHFTRVELGEVKILATVCDDLMRRNHVERVIAILLHFAGCRFFTPRSVRRVELDVGQDEVAKSANVGRTMAGAVLHDLASAGEIELAYRRIYVLAPDTLRSRLRG
jgi:CRP/FNR family transcriptional regulator, cyclic AMP receptor protein